jgi:hypothetical protein
MNAEASDADVDDRLAPAIEDRIHEGAPRAGLARGPGERTVEHVEDAAAEHDETADEPPLGPEQDRSDDGVIRSRSVFEIVMASANDPEDGPLARGDLVEGLGPEADDDLASLALGRDKAGVAEPLDVMRDERLRKPDVVDEIGDRRVAVGQPPDDAEPVHVGERLVECPDAPQVIRLVDERGDGAADPGGGWRQSDDLHGTNDR